MGGCLARRSLIWLGASLAAVCQVPFHSVALAEQDKPTPEIRLAKSGDGRRVFEVVGLSAADSKLLAKLPDDPSAWQGRFAVYVAAGSAGNDARPAMLGRYSIESGRLVFTPRFALEPGVRYRAVFRPIGKTGAGTALSKDFKIPAAPKGEPTKVVAIFPSRDRLPENQLKFYLHFSAPMARGEAYEHVRLLDAKGRAVELPFLELGEELWDPGGSRFTLFFDPGRIKRGLRPREEVGPALEEGKTYTLVVDADWHDAAGRPLAGETRKTFSVGAPDDVPPEPSNWKIEVPTSGRRQRLQVRFPEPLDHALLERMLWVETAEGRPLPGKIAIDQQETRWRFTPRNDWLAGRYQLVVTKTLEDLAGNSVDRPFEVDELKPVTESVKTEEVRLPFEVK